MVFRYLYRCSFKGPEPKKLRVLQVLSLGVAGFAHCRARCEKV